MIVDDEVPQMRALCNTLNAHGYSSTGFNLPLDALAALREQPFDLLLTDLMMPEMDGVQLLRHALELKPDIVGILMTGHGTIDTAVDAMKCGALDYILKPFKLRAILPVLARAEAVRQLRLEKKALARRVQERTAELEAANRELDAFAHSVSHDLQAPARSIKGFAQLLLEEPDSSLSERGQHFLRRIAEASEQMATLIEALLKLARLGRQTLYRQSVDVDAIVRRIVDLQCEEMMARKAEVRIEELPNCLADPLLVKQVWQNLIANAFKYSQKTEAAKIEIGGRPGKKETIYYVKDNGAGFDMKYAARLFQPFQRLHNQADFEGTGIGLSTARRILDRHRGRIWAEAEVGKGAIFYFALPVEAEDERPPSASQ